MISSRNVRFFTSITEFSKLFDNLSLDDLKAKYQELMEDYFCCSEASRQHYSTIDIKGLDQDFQVFRLRKDNEELRIYLSLRISDEDFFMLPLPSMQVEGSQRKHSAEEHQKKIVDALSIAGITISDLNNCREAFLVASGDNDLSAYFQYVDNALVQQSESKEEEDELSGPENVEAQIARFGSLGVNDLNENDVMQLVRALLISITLSLSTTESEYDKLVEWLSSRKAQLKMTKLNKHALSVTFSGQQYFLEIDNVSASLGTFIENLSVAFDKNKEKYQFQKLIFLINHYDLHVSYITDALVRLGALVSERMLLNQIDLVASVLYCAIEHGNIDLFNHFFSKLTIIIFEKLPESVCRDCLKFIMDNNLESEAMSALKGYVEENFVDHLSSSHFHLSAMTKDGDEKKVEESSGVQEKDEESSLEETSNIHKENKRKKKQEKRQLLELLDNPAELERYLTSDVKLFDHKQNDHRVFPGICKLMRKYDAQHLQRLFDDYDDFLCALPQDILWMAFVDLMNLDKLASAREFVKKTRLRSDFGRYAGTYLADVLVKFHSGQDNTNRMLIKEIFKTLVVNGDDLNLPVNLEYENVLDNHIKREKISLLYFVAYTQDNDLMRFFFRHFRMSEASLPLSINLFFDQCGLDKESRAYHLLIESSSVYDQNVEESDIDPDAIPSLVLGFFEKPSAVMLDDSSHFMRIFCKLAILADVGASSPARRASLISTMSEMVDSKCADPDANDSKFWKELLSITINHFLDYALFDKILAQIESLGIDLNSSSEFDFIEQCFYLSLNINGAHEQFKKSLLALFLYNLLVVGADAENVTRIAINAREYYARGEIDAVLKMQDGLIEQAQSEEQRSQLMRNAEALRRRFGENAITIFRDPLVDLLHKLYAGNLEFVDLQLLSSGRNASYITRDGAAFAIESILKFLFMPLISAMGQAGSGDDLINDLFEKIKSILPESAGLREDFEVFQPLLTDIRSKVQHIVFSADDEALLMACKQNNFNGINLLMNTDARDCWTLTRDSLNYEKLLHIACRSGSKPVVDLILDKYIESDMCVFEDNPLMEKPIALLFFNPNFKNDYVALAYTAASFMVSGFIQDAKNAIDFRKFLIERYPYVAVDEQHVLFYIFLRAWLQAAQELSISVDETFVEMQLVADQDFLPIESDLYWAYRDHLLSNDLGSVAHDAQAHRLRELASLSTESMQHVQQESKALEEEDLQQDDQRNEPLTGLFSLRQNFSRLDVSEGKTEQIEKRLLSLRGRTDPDSLREREEIRAQLRKERESSEMRLSQLQGGHGQNGIAHDGQQTFFSRRGESKDSGQQEDRLQQKRKSDRGRKSVARQQGWSSGFLVSSSAPRGANQQESKSQQEKESKKENSSKQKRRRY
ncbi:MAG: hypothetical protein ACE365_02580 [Gammaproteobacteria bacterium]